MSNNDLPPHDRDLPRHLDEHEKSIAREVIRAPRSTDKAISDATGIALRTVGRRRQKLEDEGLLRYWAEVDLSPEGAGQQQSRHLYTIRFRLGLTLEDVRGTLAREPGPFFASRLVYESHVAEIDGCLALLLFVVGRDELAIVNRVHNELIPQLQRIHGNDAIEGVSTVRLIEPIRRMRNYLPRYNMESGQIRSSWPTSSIYVGE